MLHRAGVTHNSLTPSKILLSYKISETALYLVGLHDARKITKYSKMVENAPLNDKPIRLNKFSSLPLHLGSRSYKPYSEPSKRDDLESLGYILVYFLKGGKLWDNLKEKGPALVKAVEKMKLNITPEIFCEGLPRNQSTLT